MKSQANVILHVMRGLLQDVRAAYPTMKGLELDEENLVLNHQTRGLSFFTLDLPNLDACLLQGLESGLLQLSGPLTRRISKRVRVPRLFGGLWLRVFDESSVLKQDADVNAIFFLRCLTTFGKKIVLDCTPDRVQATLENYHDIERRLRPPTNQWWADKLNVDPHTSSYHLGDCLYSGPDLPLFPAGEDRKKETEDRRLLEQVQQVADFLVNSFSDLCPLSYSRVKQEESKGIGFRHGTGAVAERLKNWEKSQFPNWPRKLEGFFPWALCGSTAGSPLEPPINHEVASRLICVPKTAKGPRLIAAEPTSHMWCQQLLLSWFEDQFKSLFGGSFIDLRDQSKSGDMVLKSSLDRKLATVDLSDASDRLSCWTVERIFRRHPTLLTALHAARTRYVRDDVSVHKGFLNPRKFASQGTATTFPVMSFTMLCIALGACTKGRITWSKLSRLRSVVRVYGDDIIIPAQGYARLLRAMELLQLKVNTAKSYVHGHFRESCGVDGFKGHDVTPVKPKTVVADSPTSCLAVVETSNNLFSKGLWNAALQLSSTIPDRFAKAIRIVDIREVGPLGLSSFVGGDERHLRKRWNAHLQRTEVRVFALRAKRLEGDRGGFGAFLDFVSQKHSSSDPRTVSKYARSREDRGVLAWEPRNTDSL